MSSVKFAIPQETKQKMNAFPEMNWSAIARDAIDQTIRDLEFLREFTKDSTMTEADAIRMGRTVNRSLAKRYGLGR